MTTPSTSTTTATPDLVTPGDIPRFVTYTSPVSIGPASIGTSRATTLPLNLIALIVSHLDDIGDIARLTRTSRLLYYMTLPQLYTKVHLHSFPEIRYVNGRPEGFGSGSPFTMALNGLVTKAHGNLVQEFRIWGEWKELGIEDFAKGRVPENSMMLNILLRAATDKMSRLQSFSWDLDCKPLKTLYQGLASHTTLTSLTIRFPNSRLPRPSVMIPPMLNLRVFKAMDIDPLCYPDDISMLLLHSKKLEDLRLHFSPRMRQDAESSLNLDTYFGRVLRAEYKMPLKHFAIQNYYGPNPQGMAEIIDHDVCNSVTFIDMFGSLRGNSRNVYLDDTWKNVPLDNMRTEFRALRCNEPAPQQVRLLSNSANLERLYFISAQPPKTERTPENANGAPATPAGETPPDQPDEAMTLGKQYLYALTRHHGSTLTHLLLSDQWALTCDDIGELVRFCPNMEQLGLAISSQGQEGCKEAQAMSTLRLLIPFLPKLYALRLLSNEWSDTHLKKDSAEQHIWNLGYYLEKTGARQLKWIGMGDRVYWAGPTILGKSGEQRRDAQEVGWEDVKHVAIWGLDCLDISADPIGGFGT